MKSIQLIFGVMSCAILLVGNLFGGSFPASTLDGVHTPIRNAESSPQVVTDIGVEIQNDVNRRGEGQSRSSGTTGACCIASLGGCFDNQTENSCAILGGIWGSGLTCDEMNCVVGACCYSSTCEEQVEPLCEENGGVYLGAGTLCEDFNCDNLPTACCFGYECLQLSESDCEDQGGYARGFNVTCEEVACEPAGGCCFQTDCAVLFEDICLEQGGLFQGFDTSCSDFSTCQVVSCCIASSDTCYDYTAEYCLSIKGVTGDSSCQDWDPCIDRGSCCMGGYGECYDFTTEDECDSIGGYWLMGSECVVSPCMRGNCCIDGECTQRFLDECEALGGEYSSPVLDGCDDPEYTCLSELNGACCIGGSFGCYEDWTEDNCNVFLGTWGQGLTCEELNCVEGACCYTDTWCEIEVQPYCEANGGVYLGQGTLCEDFDCASLQTACCFGYDCQSLTEEECNAQGGHVRGFNVSCEDVTCEPPGACCFQVDCESLFEDECLEQGGIFQGAESTCDDFWTCRVTSCCVGSSDNCQNYTAEYCGSIGGEPGEVNCVEWDPCITRGACCMGGYGICYDWTTQDDCDSIGGYWLPDTDCEWAPCMRGNCCVEGECMQLFYEDCMAWGGEYTGPIFDGCDDPMFYCSNTIVVDASGGGDYLTIQEGIDAANDTDTVLVRAGTYTGSGDAAVPVVDLKGKAIRLAGDPKRAGKVYIDGQSQRACIVCDSGETSETEIDLVECINGSALEGGALYCLSNPTITNCVFRDSTAQDAGGGVYIKDSQPTFIGCEFIGNESPYGGAIYMIDSSPVITDGLIAQNSASNRGGGLRMYRSSPVLTNVTIEGNWATRGGAAHIQDNSVPVLESCMILNNTADSLGGGLVTSSNSPAIYRACTFTGNQATGDNGGQGSGGAIYSDSSACVVENCVIESNTADVYGGGIYCWYSSPVITGTRISGNTSSASGGAIRTIGGSGPSLDNDILCGNSPDNIGGPWDGAGDNCLADNCQDNNDNDMPDDCEDLYCEGDANGDSVVDINDLLAILDSWGSPDGDITGDGETTIDDILIVLGNWGSCR